MHGQCPPIAAYLPKASRHWPSLKSALPSSRLLSAASSRSSYSISPRSFDCIHTVCVCVCVCVCVLSTCRGHYQHLVVTVRSPWNVSAVMGVSSMARLCQQMSQGYESVGCKTLKDWKFLKRSLPSERPSCRPGRLQGSKQTAERGLKLPARLGAPGCWTVL